MAKTSLSLHSYSLLSYQLVCSKQAITCLNIPYYVHVCEVSCIYFIELHIVK